MREAKEYDMYYTTNALSSVYSGNDKITMKQSSLPKQAYTAES